MKLPAFLILLCLGIVGYYQACAIPGAVRAERRHARDAATLDSIVDVAAQAHALERQRDSLLAAWRIRDTARGDSVRRLRTQLATLRDSTTRLGTRLDGLLATVPDSTREVVTATVQALEARAETCDIALDLQGRQLSDCQVTAAKVGVLTDSARALNAAVDSAIAIARRQLVRAERAERPWALTLGLGPGMFWTPGDSLVRFGIGATAQISYRIFRLPPW